MRVKSLLAESIIFSIPKIYIPPILLFKKKFIPIIEQLPVKFGSNIKRYDY